MARRFRGVFLAFISALMLVGCESSEERAERHYRSSVTYLEAGRVELALVDLRRVFQYNGLHRDARALYASTIRDLGQSDEAYGQYLRLVEQYPDDLEGRIALAEIAFERSDWPELVRHGERALALAPDALDVEPLSVALDYRVAATSDDPAGMAAAAQRARGLLERNPDDAVGRGIFVHHLLSSDDTAAAILEMDGVLALLPEDLELHLARLHLVMRTEDESAIAEQLARMAALFPQDQTVLQTRLAWHLSRGEADAVEQLLRQVAAIAPDEPNGYVSLVRFLQREQGDAAALAELDALVGSAAGTEAEDLYRSMAAAIAFDAGERDAAIDRMRRIVAEAQRSDQTRDIEVVLAGMLEAVGDREGAHAVIDGVLTEDPSHVAALKMRAAAAIEQDRPGEAAVDLRHALDLDPEDAEILTLMATGHEREGSLELAGERLALAVDVSGAAVPESLRYARFLLDRDRPEPARRVLESALRLAPHDLELAALMAETLIEQEDWAGVETLRASLGSRPEPDARATAEALTMAMMLSGARAEEMFARLEQRMQTGEVDGTRRDFAVLALRRAQDGDIEGARAVLADALVAYPGDPQFRMLEASLDLATGDAGVAEGKLRALVAEMPGAVDPLNELLRLFLGQGRVAEAEAVVATQLREAPDSRYLRALHGSLLVELGRIDEAIAALERLYAEDTSDIVVANNLASVLATHRADDPETLGRAAAIARRLRGREDPAFQDTYGWIELLRGNVPDALAQLEPAARGLPSDALVQYHLGRAYQAAGRPADARAQYELSLELSRGTEIEDLPQFKSARARLVALSEPALGE